MLAAFGARVTLTQARTLGRDARVPISGSKVRHAFGAFGVLDEVDDDCPDQFAEWVRDTVL